MRILRSKKKGEIKYGVPEIHGNGEMISHEGTKARRNEGK